MVWASDKIRIWKANDVEEVRALCQSQPLTQSMYRRMKSDFDNGNGLGEHKISLPELRGKRVAILREQPQNHSSLEYYAGKPPHEPKCAILIKEGRWSTYERCWFYWGVSSQMRFPDLRSAISYIWCVKIPDEWELK